MELTGAHFEYEKRRLLIITSLSPFPPRANGFAVRYAPLIKRFRRDYTVDLLLVLDGDLDAESLAESKANVDRLIMYESARARPGFAKRFSVRLKSLLGFTVPHGVYRHDHLELSEFLERSDFKEYDVVVLCNSSLIAATTKAFPTARLVVDAIDSYYLLLRRSAGRSLLALFDAMRTRWWERRLVERCDCVTYISSFDRAAVFGNHTVSPKCVVIPNGVFDDDYDGRGGQTPIASTIVYLGNMGYPPNIKAAKRAARLLQKIRVRVPDATLSIVGRGPSSEILQLGTLPGVTVTGTVPSIWPYLHAASVCLFPMEEGAGQQNKVLEAMRAGCPVVTTPIGNLGVGARDGRDLLEREDDNSLVNAVAELLQNPVTASELGQRGAEFVKDHYSWDRSWELVKRYWL